MSILIKELQLPTERLYPLHLTIYSDGNVFCGHGIGKRSYKAAEVPTPHGRLIDADDVNNHVLGYVDLRSCPTIIPAEEGE